MYDIIPLLNMYSTLVYDDQTGEINGYLKLSNRLE